MRIKYLVLFVGLVNTIKLDAQDPHFSQFFTSPLTINPAMAGNTDADWRVTGNYRHQWSGPAAPFNTGVIGYDRKIAREYHGGNILAIGGVLMYDESFYRIVKTNYAALNIAYHKQLDEDAFHHLALGFGASYGKRNISFGELTWEEQFTNNGFNTSLPTGETNLSGMKGFISASTGLLYTIDDYTSHFEFGASLYHLNKPKQTFLKDEHQIVPARYVVHSAFDRRLNDYWFLNVTGIYQQQAKLNYWIAGGGLGYFLAEDESSFFSAGLWYRNKDAIIPYIGLYKNGLQIGFSYDVTASKLLDTKSKPKTFEISISFRKKNDDGDYGNSRCPSIGR